MQQTAFNFTLFLINIVILQPFWAFHLVFLVTGTGVCWSLVLVCHNSFPNCQIGSANALVYKCTIQNEDNLPGWYIIARKVVLYILCTVQQSTVQGSRRLPCIPTNSALCIYPDRGKGWYFVNIFFAFPVQGYWGRWECDNSASKQNFNWQKLTNAICLIVQKERDV